MPNGVTTTDDQPDWFIYLLRCRNGSLYTGIAQDVSRRFLEHQEQSSKSAKYLRGKGPFVLEFTQKIGNRSSALKMERRIKTLTKEQKETLILTGVLPL